MQGGISVEAALRRGDKMIKYPVMGIFMGCIFLLPVIAYLLHITIGMGFVAGMILGFALSLLYSSYYTTKWRIWAFTNVSDVHELKVAAISDRFIPKDGSWQEQLEIRNSADKQALQQIQARFDEPYVFNDDLSVPGETVVYNAISAKYLTLFFSLVAVIAGLYILLIDGVYPVGALILFASGVGFWQYNKVSSPKPQITLSEKGIETISAGFNEWINISDENVEFYSAGKNSKYFLNFTYPSGTERLSLENIAITSRKLNHLLAVYRHRYEQSKGIKEHFL